MPRTATATKPAPPITLTSVMDELESYGSAQTRKTYARHGIKSPMYGVSYANLGTLRKRIKTNHDLALQLWQTGNHDARILATMIADPKQINEAQARAWAASIADYVQGDALAGLLASTSHARALAEQWVQESGEWMGRMGYHLLAKLALNDKDLPDAYFEPHVKTIEQEIHAAANRKREGMNNALIAIGTRSEALAQIATEAAARIGKVHIDHGETNCKTPDAVAYIHKARDRAAKRA